MKVNEKVFVIMYGIGNSRYVVNYHDGVKTHPDGGPFYDIAIFRSKKKCDEFVGSLLEDGYVNK